MQTKISRRRSAAGGPIGGIPVEKQREEISGILRRKRFVDLEAAQCPEQPDIVQ
ncbi:MAG: hypothetical protein BWY66_02107 [bacterium ADurb.Bin374]|nr:MAG: hypothetical protein BWY66_02107 [bacterium ADurb.Bin374]